MANGGKGGKKGRKILGLAGDAAMLTGLAGVLLGVGVAYAISRGPPTPTFSPSPSPTFSPSPSPTGSPEPTFSPSPSPTGSPEPTFSPSPSPPPTFSPSPSPTASPQPTFSPSPSPTGSPPPGGNITITIFARQNNPEGTVITGIPIDLLDNGTQEMMTDESTAMFTVPSGGTYTVTANNTSEWVFDHWQSPPLTPNTRTFPNRTTNATTSAYYNPGA